jgi:hypothetical protein
VKLVFGGNTMTVNRRPSGKLQRITKTLNSVSDFDPAVSYELAALLRLAIRNSECEIEGTVAFREAVIGALARTLDK